MSGMNPGFAKYQASRKSAKLNPTVTPMNSTAPKAPTPATIKGKPAVSAGRPKKVSASKNMARAGSVKLGTTVHSAGQGGHVGHPIY